MSEQVEIKKLVKVDNTNYYPVSADKGTIVTDDIDVNNNLGGKFKDKIEAPTSLYEILVELFGALKTYVTLQDNVDTDRLSNTDDTVASTKLLKSLLDNFNFPVASSTKLGGIKVGDNLKMEGDKLSTSFDIDTSLSKTSSNPVENKVLANIISDAASNTNKLADIKFVIDSIKANANYYRGSFSRWSDVPTNYDGYAEDSLRNRKPIANDYIVIEDAEDYGSGYDGAWRFIYVGLWDSNTKNGWIPGYRILESFTAEQQAAIDSGINVTLRQKIRDTDTALSTTSTNPVENRVVTNALNRKQNTLTFDSVPTSGSSNVLTSGVIKSELDKKQNNLQYDTVPVSGSNKMMTSGSIKTALDKKQDAITSSVWGASKAVVTDANSKLRVIDSVTATNVSHLSGTTSNVQTQLNSKAPINSPTFTGTPKCPTTSATMGTNIVNVDYLNFRIGGDYTNYKVLAGLDTPVFRDQLANTVRCALVHYNSSHGIGNPYIVELCDDWTTYSYIEFATTNMARGYFKNLQLVNVKYLWQQFNDLYLKSTLSDPDRNNGIVMNSGISNDSFMLLITHSDANTADFKQISFPVYTKVDQSKATIVNHARWGYYIDFNSISNCTDMTCKMLTHDVGTYGQWYSTASKRTYRATDKLFDPMWFTYQNLTGDSDLLWIKGYK